MLRCKLLFVVCSFLGILNASCQNKTEPLFTFGVIADVQYADKDNHKTRHYRSSLRKLDEAVDHFNKSETDFVISLGDFINNDIESYDTLIAITDKLQMPIYHVLGNHDFDVDEKKKDQIIQILDLKKEYYSFSKKNWRFIILNGMDISLIGNQKGSAQYDEAQKILNQLKAKGAANAKAWNGTLGEKQLKWLEKELRKAKRKDEQVVVFCHYPLYPEKSPQILWGASETRNLLESKSNVKAYFNGHVHVSQVFYKNGVNYISFRGMVEEEENSFAIISVYKDHMVMEGYGEEVDRIIN